ncbi:MAG TPA: hypothetical protein VJT33_13000 [bacterium]|nr:hypothetical protein [bacterium]
MEFDHFEYKFTADGAGQARRIASMLAEQGYNSLHRDALDLLRRYVPSTGTDARTDEPIGPRTIDVLVPAADRKARILVAERPATDGGVTVAVVAVGRSPEEAHRGRTAAKLALESKDGRDSGLAARLVSENGPARQPRFREEWARALGLVQGEGQDSAGPSPRPLASAQTLFALQGAQAVLGRPSVLRSKIDKTTNGSRVDTAQLDGLSSEGLIERSFVLMCRETGQIVGVGRDAAEVQAAMQLSLRCPHCRRPLSEEVQDVLYSLSPQGEEFIKSTRWIRDAVESSLRRRNCSAVVLSEAPNSPVDGAAYFKDAVLLFRLRDSAPGEDDVTRLQQAGAEFEKIAPGVPVRSVIVTTQPAPAAQAPAGGPAPALYLNASQLEDSMDRLLEELKRDAFTRLTGTTLEFVRLDPSMLLARAG